MKYLLDTDTLSEIVKGQNIGVLRRMAATQLGDVALSVITRGEIIYGLQIKAPKSVARQKLEKLLEAIVTLAITKEVADQYGALRARLRVQGTPIGPNDLWIAAHAKALNLILVTNNVREFSRVKHLNLESWAA